MSGFCGTPHHNARLGMLFTLFVVMITSIRAVLRPCHGQRTCVTAHLAGLLEVVLVVFLGFPERVLGSVVHIDDWGLPVGLCPR